MRACGMVNGNAGGCARRVQFDCLTSRRDLPGVRSPGFVVKTVKNVERSRAARQVATKICLNLTGDTRPQFFH